LGTPAAYWGSFEEEHTVLLVLRTTAAAAAAAACACVWSPPAFAQDSTPPAKQVPIGFSRLLVRIEGRDEIGIASADFQVRLIERMRAKGFNAVGAENLVFGKDESRRAEYLVGGTVKELACQIGTRKASCRVGVEWQLLDVARDAVVYSVMARAAVRHLPVEEKDHMAAKLVDAAMDRLLARPGFRDALIAHADDEDDDDSEYDAATLPRCSPGARVSTDANELLDRVVVVKTHDGFGSGFFVSPEGLVLTAAHVVEGSRMTLRLHDGSELQAVPVRISQREDVALLRPVNPLSGRRCLPLRTESASAGSEVYAVGAPASLALAFSLTRGIVSGYPTIAHRRRLQTDAPVNPGNSGGPIVDGAGTALGIVSFKLVSTHVEGVAFAVPVQESFKALSLQLGDATDSALLSETSSVDATPPAPKRVDTPDGVPSLDPEGDRRRAAEHEAAEERESKREEKAAEEADQQRRTPWSIPAMRWGGLGLFMVGGSTALLTYFNYDGARTTEAQFSGLRTWNTVGWTAMGVGAVSFVGSFVLRPLLLKKSALQVGPTSIGWEGTF
jgi:S1-C subfamily serine protease